MKILAVGIGKCGGQIADEFDRLNRKARSMRGLEIVTGAFAVDTDAAALSGLELIKTSYQRRILLGAPENRGRGGIAVSKVGAEIVKKDADRIVDAVRLVKRFPETDAIIVAAGAAGGTGSGGMPVIIQNMKERYRDKAVYGLVVLPFDHEIQNEEHYISNTASCLKSSSAVADGMFLVDNRRYVSQDTSFREGTGQINQLIVQPFFNLLCAGEEKNPKYIGARLMDAGDIIQTIRGWTVMGHGEAPLGIIRGLMTRSLNFNTKSRETDIGIRVMEEAIGRLSIKCNPADGASALYLLTAPPREISMNLLKYLGDYMKDISRDAIIRSGDYPIRKGLISIDVIFSQLEAVDRVRQIYEFSVDTARKEGGSPAEN
jgi:cell division GTPase FtsZ